MQLKLFTTATSKTHYLTGRKRKAKTLQSAVNDNHWDLWTEQPETDQEMALLFLDIRNFTPLTDSFQPFDIVHLVKKLLTAFQRIVRNHHGRIVETTGDGFYAAFGFNQSIEEAVNEAVEAGSAILKYLDMMNIASFEKNLERRIEAGIGIHAGKVATGRISLGGIEHLMVMGRPVNIASRLQSATKEVNNNFVISASAFHMLSSQKDNIATDVNLKGVKEKFAVRLIGRAYAS